ncbi:hypothetical protein L208DRAFT_1441552 [Tricholoma matsutake]|nr:hypothetical protein L208DRAFT_1441552 [Tricholoma matsutake 945]
MVDALIGQGTHRPASLRSVASNSSVSSGVSLTRRSRTRTRPKTAGSSGRADSLTASPISELPYIDTRFVLGSSRVPPSTMVTELQPCSDRDEAIEVQNDDTSLVDERIAVMDGVSEGSQSPPMTPRLSRPARKTSGLQVQPSAAQPEPHPSAFSRDPSLTRINASGVNVRDSVSTHGTSSSLYPLTISTTSGPESPPSPRSMTDQDENYDVSSYDPEVGDVQEYVQDDVSYRLRLLVNNNYFLPPAHAKPSPSDFAPPALAISKKPSTPTFMDLLRGKSKSKPTTPTSSPAGDPTLPALRTAADSITPSYALRPPPRSSSQIPRIPHPGDRSGRVVVVREKVHDLAVAAKQAEQDLKARGVRRDQGSQPGQVPFDNVVDPTDVVDLPPPSAAYPFAVQASALHGLGVQDSVGAAVLADRLPPPKSPGMSSSDADEDWRKALLQQAVHLSLDSTSPDMSSFSAMVGSSSTPLASPRVTPTGVPSRGSSPGIKRLLEQRIISNPRFSDLSPPHLSRKKSSQSQASESSSKERTKEQLPPPGTPGPRSSFPLRADTPSGPVTPLSPAPRKFLINPLHSLSQTELPQPDHQPGSSLVDSSHASLRKVMSSPMLSDAYESDDRHSLMTPPPLPITTLSSHSSLHGLAVAHSLATSQERPTTITSESQYSEDEVTDDDDVPRSSLALSVVQEGRPSLSSYSQPSPATSAFRDALSFPASYRPAPRPTSDQISSARGSPVPRYSATSPPPRMSSSLAHVALSPPPRSSSLHYRALQARIPTSTRGSEPEHSPLTDDTTLVIVPQEIVAPEPTTPPFPISERRGNPASRQLSLDIPPTTVPVAIHSAPGPSSPTSFFDSIQAQPNAMDDLDSSSESEEDDENVTGNSRDPTNFYVDPRTRLISSISEPRPTLMRLGNHSTPYVGSVPQTRRPSLAFGVGDQKPVGNTPVRPSFFTERSGKSDQGHGSPVSSFEFYRIVQQQQQQNRPATSTGGPSTVFNKPRSATVGPGERLPNQKAQESLRKLDGMLIQHMEAEKDTIKRIATTARSHVPSKDKT